MGALTHNGEVLQRLPADASQINFDKTGTNLNSTQTENAIKEVNTKVNTNTADITQLKSGLTDLENHNLDGNVIDITSYTSGNTYTTPSDGFVRVSASTEAINVIRKNGVQFCILTGTGSTELSVYVKKGTQLVVDNPSTAKFLPYVN